MTDNPNELIKRAAAVRQILASSGVLDDAGYSEAAIQHLVEALAPGAFYRDFTAHGESVVRFHVKQNG